MSNKVSLQYLDDIGRAWAQETVTHHHYRHAPVPGRACPESWAVVVEGVGPIGCLIVGRPQATVCRPWYGSVDEAMGGRCQVTRWQVVNLARVWLDPRVQVGGEFYDPDVLPGFVDRNGLWRSTLASDAIGQLAARIGGEYLQHRPPVFLDEPYELRWLMSYCDPAKHRGVIYRAAGFELYRVNEAGLQTWRLPVAPLTAAQHAMVADASAACPRGRRFRSERDRDHAQLRLEAVA